MLEFERFFEIEYGGVVRSLALAFGDVNWAEEAAQGAFAAAYQRRRTVKSMDRPGTWVYVVALRAERRRLARTPDVGGPRTDLVVDDQTAEVVDGVWITKALDSLTARQRCAVVLRYYADLSVNEVAQAMGCAPGTVKATVHVALGRLRVQLHQEEGADAN